jgi:type II secretory pathway pseudopilin PulG
MSRRILRSSDGFTYIAALVMVVIMGIILGQAASVWSTRMKRERETELIFRGTQIRDAMRRYYGMAPDPYGPTPGAAPLLPLTIPATAPKINELKDLVQAPTAAGKRRYLRKLYLDPMTGKDFELLRNPNQQIVGVRSTSGGAPIKQGNFPFDLFPDDFEGKKKYSEWWFVCDHYPPTGLQAGSQKGLPTPGAGSTKSDQDQ